MRGYAYTEIKPDEGDEYQGWDDESHEIDRIIKYDFDAGGWLIVNLDGDQALINHNGNIWIEEA